jgi:hypothetical protein
MMKNSGFKVLWNQLADADGIVLSKTFTSDFSSYYFFIGRIRKNIKGELNHTYYARAKIYREIEGDDFINMQIGGARAGQYPGQVPVGSGVANGFHSYLHKITISPPYNTPEIYGNNYKSGSARRNFKTGDYIEFSYIQDIDVTQMFGEGKEPPTTDDFEEWLMENGYDLNEYILYDAGTEKFMTKPKWL